MPRFFIIFLINVPDVFLRSKSTFFLKVTDIRTSLGRFPVKTASCLSVLFYSMFLLSCAEKTEVDPCCQYAEVSPEMDVNEGKGAILISGSTASTFYVLDESGEQVAYQSLNKVLTLDPGDYRVKVNNTTHDVEVRADQLTTCSTGTLMISGNTGEYYTVMDSSDIQLGYETLGKPMSFFPGTVKVSVNNTTALAQVKLKELAEMRTGALRVKGATNEYYYVLDHENKQLNYNTLGKPLAFLPGSYVVKVNNTSMKADVIAGNVTDLATGTVVVKGLTEEYYYVTDTVGNALNYQTLNKPLSFFPGKLHIKVNNTMAKGQVAPGKTTEFMTGSLMLTGGSTGYYYVLDESGNQLNYNSLNKSLSFFPSQYTVKLGPSSRKATVIAGQRTSLTAFN